LRNSVYTQRMQTRKCSYLRQHLHIISYQLLNTLKTVTTGTWGDSMHWLLHWLLHCLHWWIMNCIVTTNCSSSRSFSCINTSYLLPNVMPVLCATFYNCMTNICVSQNTIKNCKRMATLTVGCFSSTVSTQQAVRYSYLFH